jgi:F420-0:gamma-glutamyl ligase-like protein
LHTTNQKLRNVFLHGRLLQLTVTEMKRKNFEIDYDKKVRKVTKGVDKSGKYRKSIYNMLEEEDESLDLDNGDVDDYEDLDDSK